MASTPVQGPVAPVAPALPSIPQLPGTYAPQIPGYVWQPPKDPRSEMIAKYGDPYELNSLVDALFNSEAKRRTGTTFITAPFKLLWDRTIKPVSKGYFGVALLNALINVGETFDVIANPVKGLLIEGVSSLEDSIGFGTEGRRQYDWDTGNLLKDIGFEILSDPLNWASGGGKLLLSAIAKKAMVPLMKEAVAEVGEAAAKKLVNKTVSAYIHQGSLTAAKQVDWKELMQRTATQMSKTIIAKPLKISKATLELVADRTMNNLNRTAIPALTSLLQSVESVESGIMKAAMTSTGIGLTWYGGKGLYTVMGRIYQNNVVNRLRRYVSATGGIKIGDYEKVEREFEQIITVTEKADALANIDPKAAQLLLKDTLHTTFKNLERSLVLSGGDYKKLMIFLDKNAEYHNLSDYVAFRTKLEQIAEKHPGVFDEYINRLHKLDENIENMRTYNIQKEEYDKQILRIETLEKHKKQYTFKDTDSDENIIGDIAAEMMTENISTTVYKAGNRARLKRMISPWGILRAISPREVKEFGKEFGEDILEFYKFLGSVTYFKDKTLANSFFAELTLEIPQIKELVLQRMEEFVAPLKTVLAETKVSLTPELRLTYETLYKDFDELAEAAATAFHRDINTAISDIPPILDEYNQYFLEDSFYPEISAKFLELESRAETLIEAALNAHNKMLSIEPENFRLVNSDISENLDELLQGSITKRPHMLKGIKDFRSGSGLSEAEQEAGVKSIGKKIRNILKQFKKNALNDIVENLTAAIVTPLGKRDFLQVNAILEDLPTRFTKLIDAMGWPTSIDNKYIYDLPRLIESFEAFAQIYSKSNFARLRQKLDQLFIKGSSAAENFNKTLDDFWSSRGEHIDRYINTTRENSMFLHGQANEILLLEKRYAMEDMFDKLYNGSKTVTVSTPVRRTSMIDQVINMLTAELSRSFKQNIPKHSALFPERLELELKENLKTLLQINAKEGVYPIVDALLDLRRTLDRIRELPSVETSKEYISITHLLEPIENLMRNFDPREVEHAVIDYTGKEVYYKMQLSHIYSLLSLSTLEGIEDVVYNLSSPLHEWGEILHNLLTVKSTAPYAQTVIDYIESYTSFQTFLEGFFAANIRPELRAATLDTLMRLQRSSSVEVLSNFEKRFSEIIAGIELQMYSISMTKKLDLDSLRKLDPAFAHLKNRPGAHTGVYDAETTVTVLQHFFPEIYNDPKLMIMTFDIETTGLHAYINSLYDVSYQLEQGGKYVSNRAKTTEVPPPSVLRNDLHMTEAEFRDQAALNTLSEVEALRNFLTDIATQQSKAAEAGQKFILSGHNINQFDLEFVKKRIFFLSQLEGSQDLKSIVDWDKLEILDTMQMLRKKQGWEGISDSEALTIKDLLLSYVLKESENSTELAIGLFQPISGNFALALDDLMKAMKTSTKKENAIEGVTLRVDDLPIMQVLSELSGLIWQNLNALKRTNRGTNTLFMQKTLLDQDNTNITQFLSNGLDKIMNYSTTRYIDEPAVYNWFDIPVDTKTDMAKLIRYSKVAKRILDKKVSYLRRVYPLAPYYDEMGTILQEIKNAALPNSLLADMRIPSNLPERWAWLQYAVQKISKNEELTPGLTVNLSKPLATTPRGLQTFLYDPSPLYDRTISEGTMSYVDAASGDHNLKELAADYSTILDEMDTDLIEAGTILKTLSETLDEHHIALARSQAKGVYLKQRTTPLRDMIAHVRTTLESMPFYKNRKAYVQQMQNYTTALQKQQTLQAVQLTLPDFVRHLYHNAKSFISFDLTDFPMEKQFLENVSYYIQNQKELETLGASILVQGTRVTFILNEHANLKELQPIVMRELDMAIVEEGITDPTLLKHLRDVRQQLANDYEESINGSVGDFIFAKAYRNAYASVPDAVKLLHPEIRTMLESGKGIGIFQHGGFNHSFLGTKGRLAIQPYTPRDILKIYVDSTRYAAQYPNVKALYLNMYTDPSLQLSTGAAFKDLSNEELLVMLKHSPEYRLVALIEDSAMLERKTHTVQGYKVINIVPHDLKSIEYAKNLGAIIVPTQTYSKMVETINNFQFKGVFEVWHKILFTFKAGYLASIGLIFRNMMDTIIKNTIEGVDMRTQMATIGIYMQYKRCLSEILYADQYNVKGVLKYFETPRKIDYKLFSEIHDLLNDGPIGQVKAMEKYYIKKAREKRSTDGLELTENQNKLWGTFLQINQFIMTPNAEVEQIARLAMYLSDMEKGMNKTSAFYHIAKTHFDYTLKSDMERYIELVIPFYTFAMRNLEYWVDAVTTKPWLMGMLRDVMTPIWNLDGYDDEEFRKNRSLQYQVLSGALPLGDSGLTLKLGPSFMDAFNIMIEPIEAISNRVVAPLAVAYDALAGNDADLSALIPIGGTVLQRRQSADRYYERTDNLANIILPSLFGATQRWKPRSATAYIKKAPKAKAIRAKKLYVKKTYIKGTWSNNRYKKTYYKMMAMPRFYRGTDFYKKLYTRTGRTQTWLKKIPLTPKTLRFKVRFISPQFFKR